MKLRNVNMTLAEIVSAYPHVALSAIRKVHPEWLSAEYNTPKLSASQICPGCKGNGGPIDPRLPRCKTCKGTGKLQLG